MSRLIGRQLFRSLHSSPRNPLHRFLHYPLRSLSSQYTRSAQDPFYGEQRYNGLIRRFASQPNPLELLNRKREKEAIDRGEYFDVHDGGDADLKDYDVLIPDLHEEDLRSGLSEALGIRYLAKATEAETNEVVRTAQGVAFGSNKRPIFPCVVKHGYRAHWVFFLVDSGAPLTYLSEHACDVLGLDVDDTNIVKIAGYPHSVQMSPKNAHFQDINLLGWDFCYKYKMGIQPGYHRLVQFPFLVDSEKSNL